MPNFLTEDQILVLKENHRQLRDKRLADRIKAILMLNVGYTYDQIKYLLLLDETTMRRYMKIYRKKGVNGLLEMKYKGGQTNLTLLQESELKEYLTLNTKRTVILLLLEFATRCKRLYIQKLSFAVANSSLLTIKK
jgi:transposase